MLHSHTLSLSVFESGFAESTSDIALEPPSPDDASISDAGAFAQQFDDSDFEDDDVLDNDGDFPIDDPDAQANVAGPPPNDDTLSDTSATASSGPSSSTISNKRASVGDDEVSETHNVLGPDATDEQNDEQDDEQSARNTRPKLSHPSTPRTKEMRLERAVQVPSSPLRTVEILPVQSRSEPEVSGPKKARVVVKDVAYATYRAVLYYVRLLCTIGYHYLCYAYTYVDCMRPNPY